MPQAYAGAGSLVLVHHAPNASGQLEHGELVDSLSMESWV